ncbi:YciI family protein [Benzoatithermus flavus]|uniref:YciI family protein n=1 Tax=Benzoatithermus flavus TaxID=3108223 RepID=A0ABU8XVD2_9PROT
MPQFLVIAHDGTDPEAPARRQAARPAHLAFIRPMVERGEIVAGGAILDEAGVMTGSAVIVDFPDRAALDAWLARDPYVVQGVWQRIEVRPFRLAALTPRRDAT